MKSIAMVCSRLDLQGGIERASVNLANLFYKKGHAVTIIILDVTAKLFYPLDAGIDIIQEELHFGITTSGTMITRKLQWLQHIFRLRKIYKNLSPDFIITTEYSLTVPSVFAVMGFKSILIGWEHHHFFWVQKNRFWSLLFRHTYPRLRAVVTQNSTEKKLFENMGCSAVVIPYVVPQQAAAALLEAKVILTIGWLIKRKGVDLVPAVAEKVFKQHPDWIWKVIGEGEEYEVLTKEINGRALQNNVIIQRPVSARIEEEYLNASIFALLSRFECLPLVLLEATSFGVPCVAFDCPTGPADIIHHNSDGYLVPVEEVDAMAKAINTLIEDEASRKTFGSKAKQASHRYADETIYQQWMDLFVTLSSNQA